MTTDQLIAQIHKKQSFLCIGLDVDLNKIPQHLLEEEDPVFSFNKFPNVNKQLGPEMKSTGESILFIDSLKEDEFYDLYARRKMYLTK